MLAYFDLNLSILCCKSVQYCARDIIASQEFLTSHLQSKIETYQYLCILDLSIMVT